MRSSLSLMATIAALGLAGSAYAFEPADQAGQPAPGSEPRSQSSTLPSTEDPSSVSRQSDPSGTQPPSDDPSMARSSSSPDSLETRLAAVVPAGMSATEACAGFGSTAECAATLHASRNLGLSFVELKSKVTGGQKLGAAIKELKPGVNVKAEVRKAEQQARADSPPPQG